MAVYCRTVTTSVTGKMTLPSSQVALSPDFRPSSHEMRFITRAPEIRANQVPPFAPPGRAADHLARGVVGDHLDPPPEQDAACTVSGYTVRATSCAPALLPLRVAEFVSWFVPLAPIHPS